MLLRAKTYDIVLSDYQLNSWTGMDALRVMRAEGKDIPFILVTGALGDDKAVECIKNGVWDYVLKDRLHRLPVAVSRAVQEKSLREECRKAEVAAQEREEQFRILTETIASAVIIYDGKVCCYSNRAAELITGYSREELQAMSFLDILDTHSREMVIEKECLRMEREPLDTRFEIKVRRKDGELKWLDVTGGLIEFEGRKACLITAVDITDRKQREDEIQQLLITDPLTGLGNYRRLTEVMNGETERSRRTGRSFTLTLFDLDGLKEINDTIGHLAGNRALCRVANALRHFSRTVDTAVRHGGDEFALLLPETDAEGARHVAERVTEQLAREVEHPHIAVSYGIAMYPSDGGTVEEIFRAADTALYAMKSSCGRKQSLRS